MQRRSNRKFVILLIVGLLLVGMVGVGAYYWYGVRRNPDRYLAQAEKLIHEGDHENADRAYGKAYVYEKNPQRKIEILITKAEALRDWPAETNQQLQERLGGVEACWRTIREIDPEHERATREMLQMNYDRAKLFAGNVNAWTSLYNLTDDALALVPDSTMIKRYRGLAQVARMEQIDLTDQQRQQARDDLEAVLPGDPEDVTLNFNMARWFVAEAANNQRLGRDTRAAELRAEAEKRARQFYQQHADDPEAALALVRILWSIAGAERDESRLEEIRSLLSDIEQQLLQTDLPDATMITANLLLRIDQEQVELDDGTTVQRGLWRAEQLLRHRLSHHPDDLETMVSLASLLKRQGRLDHAIEFYAAASAERKMPIEIGSLQQRNLQLQAIKELGELYLAKHEMDADPPAEGTWLDLARQQVEELVAQAGGTGWAYLMEGKLALVDGDYRLAVKKLDAADRQFSGQNIDAIRLSAQALLQLGESGAAAERLERFIGTEMGGRFIKPYLDLAQLRLQQNDLARARRYVQTILEQQPTNTRAQLLMSDILVREGAGLRNRDAEAANERFTQALQILEAFENQDEPAVVQRRARLYRALDQDDKALALLEEHCAEHPEDIASFQRLLGMYRNTGQTDKALALIDQAIEQHPDRRQLLELLRGTVTGETEQMADQVRQILEADSDDPIGRELKLRAFAMQRQRAAEQAGDQALAQKYQVEADEHLAKAMELDATNSDERILRLKFSQAIGAEDWDSASQVVTRVAQLNDGEGLDRAHGRLWLGELQVARKQWRQARETYEQALDEMPTDSNAWRMLGDIRQQLSQPIEAETAYRQSVELNPRNTAAWQRLAQLYDTRGEHNQALDAMRQLLHFSGGDMNVYLAYLDYLGRYGDRSEALTRRLQLAEQLPDNKANQLSIAQLYIQLDQRDKAGQILTDLLAENPDDRQVVLAMAGFERLGGDPEQGKQLIRDYIGRQGDQATVADWLGFARYLRQAGQPDAAKAAYRQAIRYEDAQRKEASRELADWLFASGDFDGAAELYARILDGTQQEQLKLNVWRRYVDTLVQADRIDQAQQQLQGLLEVAERDAQIALLQGLIAERQDRTADAGEAYDAAIALNPSLPAAYVQRARYRVSLDDPQQRALAERDLQRAIDLDQRQIMPREMLRQLHIERGDLEAATNITERLVESRPEYMPGRVALAELYLRRGRSELGSLERLLADSENRFAGQPVWDQIRARMAAMAGQTDQAVASLRRAYEKNKTPTALVNYLEGLLTVGEAQTALDVLGADWAEAMDDSAVLQAVRARCLSMLNRRNDAISGFKAALAKAGQDPRQLQVVITHLNRSLDVEARLSLLQPLSDSDTTGYVEMNIAQSLVAQGELDEAIDRLGALTTAMPQNVTALRMLAATCYQARRYDEARRYYEVLLEQTGEDLMALNNLAYLLADQLDAAEAAIPYAKRALAAVDDNPARRANILDTLGWVQFKAGRLTEAIGSLRQSVALRAMPANHLHLGQAYLANQQYDLAREQLIRARNLADENSDTPTRQEADQLLQSIEAAAANAKR
jgi:tetratricopeptide (TPR) repeat protein